MNVSRIFADAPSIGSRRTHRPVWSRHARLRAPALLLLITVWILPAPTLVSRPVSANQRNVVRFMLVPNPNVVNCLARFPGDANRPPTAEVTVFKDANNDVLTLTLRNVKPGLGFDLFTVQRSSLLSSGRPDPAFTNFGFAWYQTDLDVNDDGESFVEVRTVLLDEIFGFNPDVKLPPTPTFHVGIWFDDPMAAAACGFDPNSPTPFNGEHKAGPVAMISLPDATTGAGPLLRRKN